MNSQLLLVRKILYFHFCKIFILGMAFGVDSFLSFSTSNMLSIYSGLHSFWWEVCYNSYLCSSVCNVSLPNPLLSRFSPSLVFSRFTTLFLCICFLFWRREALACLGFSEFCGYVAWCPSSVLENSQSLPLQIFLLPLFSLLLLELQSHNVRSLDIVSYSWLLCSVVIFFPTFFLFEFLFGCFLLTDFQVHWVNLTSESTEGILHLCFHGFYF